MTIEKVGYCDRLNTFTANAARHASTAAKGFYHCRVEGNDYHCCIMSHLPSATTSFYRRPVEGQIHLRHAN